MIYPFATPLVASFNSDMETTVLIPPALRVTRSPLISIELGSMLLFVFQAFSVEMISISSQAIGSRSARGLLPFEILEIVNFELASEQFISECTAAYLATVRGFITEHVVHKLVAARGSRGMFEATERENEWDADTDLSMGASGKSFSPNNIYSFYSNTATDIAADKAIVDNKSKVTESQLRTFLQLCWVKYVKARIEPG
jgi:DNA-directed RNA polymerase III subunit RPC1